MVIQGRHSLTPDLAVMQPVPGLQNSGSNHGGISVLSYEVSLTDTKLAELKRKFKKDAALVRDQRVIDPINLDKTILLVFTNTCPRPPSLPKPLILYNRIPSKNGIPTIIEYGLYEVSAQICKGTEASLDVALIKEQIEKLLDANQDPGNLQDQAAHVPGMDQHGMEFTEERDFMLLLGQQNMTNMPPPVSQYEGI